MMSRFFRRATRLQFQKKAVHRLIGAGSDGVILEISKGEFDESDIVRLEDDYKR